MNYPKVADLENTLELKLGIKSSLPNPKKMLGLLFLIWSVEKKSEISYSIQDGSEKIKLPEEILEKIMNQYSNQIDYLNSTVEEIKERINENPLFEAQLEALIVALELIWKLCKVRFADGRAMSSERSGRKRYKKVLQFTKNIDLLDILIDDSLILIFLKWTCEEKISEEEKGVEKKLIKYLTCISEEAIYRLKDEAGRELDFRQNGIYKTLLGSKTVDIKSSTETKGSLRILKTIVKEGLNSYLTKGINNDNLSTSGLGDGLEEYQKRVENYLKLINYKVEFIEQNNIKHIEQEEKEEVLINKKPFKPHNRILYGAPGTGKSYKFYEELKDYPPEQIERVTFYSDYTYGKFIGMFKPTSGADYTYQEGPFLRILKKALENPEFPYFLIVEEINRTDTASTFGDIFQLLDRNDDGRSSYEIDISEDMKSYFDEGNLLNNNKLYIPNNLYIWATMNSADQGVYPLDSAFKRRWSMEYVDINNGEEKRNSAEIKLTTYKPIHWNTLREKLNDMMDSKGIREDKQLGVFFLKAGEDDKGEFNEEGFKNKLLMYLSEDVFRHQKREVFKKNTYGKILRDFKEGKEIFISGEKEFDELNSLFEKV